MYLNGWSYKGKDEVLAKNMPHLPQHLAYRSMGLMEIFKYIHYAAIAMAVGERGADGERFIWLNRDNERPIHLVDLTETLGQIWFFSTPEIWKNAISSIPEEMRKKYIPANHKVGIFQSDEVWLLHIKPDENGKDVWSISKFRIARTKYQDYDPDEEAVAQIKRPLPEFELEVVTRLNEKEEVVVPSSYFSNPVSGPTDSFPLVQSEEEKKKKHIDPRG